MFNYKKLYLIAKNLSVSSHMDVGCEKTCGGDRTFCNGDKTGFLVLKSTSIRALLIKTA